MYYMYYMLYVCATYITVDEECCLALIGGAGEAAPCVVVSTAGLFDR